MACQECGGDLWANDGWTHVDGPPDDDHEAAPDDDDFDNDEYGQHRDPARAYDDYKQQLLEDHYRQGRRTAGKADTMGTPLNGRAALRHAAREFIASENTADRGELAFRAARYIDTLTGTWSREAARDAAALFVAAVEDEPCGGCNAEAGEKCRPWCTGEQAQKNEKADKKHSYRTAAALPDFDDSLLFGD